MRELTAQPVAKDTNVPCKDTISRQDAIDTCMRDDVHTGYDAACLIAQLPSAQPEQKKGKWIVEGNRYYCPFCGKGIIFAGVKVANYCSYCGSDLRGDEYE